MIPATDPEADYKALVKRSYDECAAAYAGARAADPGPAVRKLSGLLRQGAAVLDIGCGAGVPVARTLAERHQVTGVDLSPEMVRLARNNVPAAEFRCADIMSANFASGSFDGVVAFYSVFHLPREEHSRLFRKVHQWLKPAGYLLCTLAYANEEGYLEDFHGTTMYWSNYSLDEYVTILGDVGFEVLDIGSTADGYEHDAREDTEDHPLVLARKSKPSVG